jgi:8-oxo-dGTP pyrophosphatase MutT (NUDIX family)
MAKDLSPIQNRIISTLKGAVSLRYSELQLEDIPNDLFNYHLQHLVQKGFVDRKSEGYALSPVGIKYVADPYPVNDAVKSLFKINVIAIVSRVRNKKIEILNQMRASNPSYGKVGVIGGVVLKGEGIEAAATRKLEQETGLNAEFRLVGCERRIMYTSGALFSDVMFPITYADAYSGELEIDTTYGHNLWVPIGQAIENESAEFDSLKGVVKVLEAIKAKKIKKLPFFFQENIQKDTDA